MLKTLIDLFLLISTDKKTITYDNISTFYKFIIKKLPEIESKRPFLISSSLNKKNLKQIQKENIIDEKIGGSQFQNNELNNNSNKNMDKNISIKKFQDELLSLFYDFIDYLYEENIIILNEEKMKILTNKINKKLKDKNMNNKKVISIKKNIIRNYIIELINNNKNNNNFISSDLSIKNFINFFNTKNQNKNRLIAEKFIIAINPIIKIYKNDRKIIYRRKINKSKTKSLPKVTITLDDNNIIKMSLNNDIKNENNKNDIKYNYRSNHSINEKKILDDSINKFINNKNKRKTDCNNKSKMTKKNLIELNNLSHDTIQCDTLINSKSYNNFQYQDLVRNCIKIKTKKISANTKLNNINENQINFKNDKSYSKKILIDEIKKYYSKIPTETYEDKNNKINNKSFKNVLNNKDFTEKDHVSNNLKSYNLENIRKVDSLISSKFKKEDSLTEKSNGCFIY